MFSTIRLQVFVCLALGLAVQAAPAGTAGAEMAARSPHNSGYSDEHYGDYDVYNHEDHSNDIFGEGGIFGTGNDDDVDFLNADFKRGLSLGSMSNVDAGVDLADLAHVGVGADSSASAASDTADLASILASVNAGASADVDRRLIIEETLGAGEDLLNSFGLSGNADTSTDTSSSDSSTDTSFSGGASGMGSLGGLSGLDFGSAFDAGANLGRRQDDTSVTASSTSVSAEASATAGVNANASDINSILQQLQNDQDFSVDGNGIVHGGQLNGFDFSTVVSV